MAKSFSYSFEVCKCKHVSLGEIVHAINDKNAKTIKKIGDLTDAGTSCMCCQCKEKDTGEQKMKLHLNEIIKKFED